MQYYDDFYDGLKETRNILYRQIDTVAALNKLLSTLCCEVNNLKNYKINLVGENVLPYKIHFNTIINIFNEYETKIQELIKIKEGYPIYQLNDIENISLIKTLSSIDYKINTVNANLNNEFKTLKKLICESIENALKEQDFSTISILSELLFNINRMLMNMPL